MGFLSIFLFLKNIIMEIELEINELKKKLETIESNQHLILQRLEEISKSTQKLDNTYETIHDTINKPIVYVKTNLNKIVDVFNKN